MSEGGALQQRTTYLISLTLVKVEAVEENGGEVQSSTPGREATARSRSRSEESRAEKAGVKVETEAQSGPGETQAPPPGTDAPVFVVQDEGMKPQSTLTDEPVCAVDAPRTSSEKGLCKPSIPLQPERADADLTPAEKIHRTPEAKQSRPPFYTSTPPTEVGEPARTPTRTSLPVRPVGQRPMSLLKSHSGVAPRGRDCREGRERSPTSAQSLDRKDCRTTARSPGPCRASWAEAGGTEAWRDPRDEVRAGTELEIGGRVAAMLRDMPRKDRLKSGSTSLPAQATQAGKPPRKGKSRTLDNSDLNSLSEDLARSGEAQQGQRGASKDRKMLKFISGIFTKSNSSVAGSSTSAAPVLIQRDSSEEEVNIANSQEWSLSRSIPELRLGILGSVKSGKSALVTKYITGAYVALDKPDGGRYKKEVLVDGQSYLLLIREEAGPPDAQFSSWADAVILVFSLENEDSFQELYRLYGQLGSRRADVPVVVVGTQDKISSTNPRVIEDQRARQLCIDVRHSLFYETCATYGFNVDRVFSEAAQKIVAQKKQVALQACKSLPNSPSHSGGSTPGSASFPGQVSNGVSGGYACSLPSTPVLAHRELRAAQGEGGGSSRSLKSIPRRPSLFKNRDSEKRVADAKGDASGARAVPIKQSILWKRSGSSLNKEWKKKYVTLSRNGTLCYHTSPSFLSCAPPPSLCSTTVLPEESEAFSAAPRLCPPKRRVSMKKTPTLSSCRLPDRRGTLRLPVWRRETRGCQPSRVRSWPACSRVRAAETRPHLGQSQPGCADLHRVFGNPSEPGHSPVSGALAGPGRLARRADASAVRHREPHGQQRLGGPHSGQGQAHARGFTRRERVVDSGEVRTTGVRAAPPAACGRQPAGADAVGGDRARPGAAPAPARPQQQGAHQRAAARRRRGPARRHGPARRLPAGRRVRNRRESEGPPGPDGHDDGEKRREQRLRCYFAPTRLLQ
ncbi:arf-GAP with GTPase, ANK repeat and PH domain-containing protein 2 isoform X8 [Phycodurus eques]|uniref:arf-GAP with GTPase, ANK repeat and PH domain-containing protein 2 isoform X8 n=1 Tax=Phycodurus eques TaxID=693459 RepID=UPI002ACEE430|nr:arf-GAP with GTPase, ANK repeat and PH domain-containing protein 2 isoform X8 [Phycodurus eques]